jgi:hypothetical protein
MKTKKILARLQGLLDSDQRAQARQADAIKEVLGKLRKKEQHFKEKLEQAENDEQREKFGRKLAVCHAQRKKGLEALKQIQSQL